MMSAPEMINELKRLSSVVTELETSNINLANMIAQQTAMIAQQVVTNTNLTAQLATLTSITGQLVEVNTRALDDADKAHEPLPYDYEIVQGSRVVNLNHGSTVNFVFTGAADWGAGLDFYPISLAIDFYISAAAFHNFYDSILMWCYELFVPPIGNTTILSNIMTPLSDPPYRMTAFGTGIVSKRWIVPKNKINTGNSFFLTITNRTNGIINPIYITLLGMAVEPV